MVNEYSSVGSYDASTGSISYSGPSAGYSGAGGGSPGSSYVTDTTSAASMAAATVTGIISAAPTDTGTGYGYTAPIGPVQGGGILPSSVESWVQQAGTGYGYTAPIGPVQGGGILPSSVESWVQQQSASSSAQQATQQAAQQAAARMAGTYYVPYGSRTQTELKDISAVRYGAAGEVGFYQNLYTPEGNLRNITNLVSSGGPGALQSGMFSTQPLTPDIRTQENPEAYARTAIPISAAAVRAAPDTFSRLGAEVYGGYVLPLDASKTVESVGAELSTYAPESGNLASLISPQGANLQRSAYVSLPWGEFVAPGSGTKRVGGGETIITAPAAQFAASSYDIIPKSQAEIARGQTKAGGLDIGRGTPYVPSDTIMLPQKTTIDIGTIPIVGVFAAPVAGALGVKPTVEAGSLGAFFNPQMKETTRAGTPVALPETIVPGETTTRKTETGYEITSTATKVGGTVTPYVTTQEVAGKSGYEKFQQNIRNVLPAPEASEKVVQLAALTMPVIGTLTMPSAIAEAKGDTEAGRYAGMLAPLKGQYTQFYDEPVMVPISFGVGAALGGITGVGAKYYPAIKAASGESRAVGAMDVFITNVAPKALAGLYAADIAARSVGYSTSGIQPEAVSRARGIVIQEAAPMGAGFAFGAAPRAPIEAAARKADVAFEKTSEFFTQEPVRLPEGYENLLEVRAGPQLMAERARPSRPGQIEEASPRIAAVDISNIGLTVESPSAAALESVKNYGQRTQGYPARTLQETEMIKGRMATPTEEYFAQPVETSPLAQLSATGRMGPTFKEQVKVAEYLKYSSELYGQPESVQTQLYKLGRLEPTANVPLPTIEPMTTPDPFAGLAKEMGVRAEPVTPKGLETKASGAPMSRQMLESVVTKSAVTSGGKISSIEDIIKNTEAKSIAKPIVQAAESQRILPSATKKTFAAETVVPKEKFKAALESVVGEEKRPASSGRLPKGMQLDYLKDALSARRGEVIPRSAFIEQGAMEKPTVGSSASQRLREERAAKGATTASSTSDKMQRVPVSNQTQPQKTINEQAIGQKQRSSDFYGTPTMGLLVSPKKTTSEKVVPFITPARTQTPVIEQRLIRRPPPPQIMPPVKIPGIPSLPMGGGGAGARGERGRRFTQTLEVGRGIGWIDITGKQQRRKK